MGDFNDHPSTVLWSLNVPCSIWRSLSILWWSETGSFSVMITQWPLMIARCSCNDHAVTFDDRSVLCDDRSAACNDRSALCHVDLLDEGVLIVAQQFAQSVHHPVTSKLFTCTVIIWKTICRAFYCPKYDAVFIGTELYLNADSLRSQRMHGLLSLYA